LQPYRIGLWIGLQEFVDLSVLCFGRRKFIAGMTLGFAIMAEERGMNDGRRGKI
jgi:hypothetical protein